MALPSGSLRRGGLAAGTAAAAAASSALSSLLFGVNRLDVAVYVLAIVLLAAVATIATWLPARRAARTPPAFVLRG